MFRLTPRETLRVRAGHLKTSGASVQRGALTVIWAFFRFASLGSKELRRACVLDLRDRLLRAFQQFLHFLHINLRGGIVLMPHHFLHARRIGIVEQGKGGGRVP